MKTKLINIFLTTLSFQGRKPLESFSSAVAFAFYSLLQLGSNFLASANNISSRLAILVTSLPFFLLYAFYTADLTATMTARPKPPGINSFSDILQQSSLQVVPYKVNHLD
jgi:hypothetical protein